jgi:hypothetical protein
VPEGKAICVGSSAEISANDPAGWKAVWNSQYNEWFYVNTHTKQSQWDKPTEPVYSNSADASPLGAPPGYDHNNAVNTGPEKGSNNPFHQSPQHSGNMSEDERLARELQAQEQQRAATGSRGASDGYYGQQPSSPYGQQTQSSYVQQSLPPREEKKGFLGKLSSKLGGGSSSKPQYGGYGGYPQQSYGQPAYGGGYGQPGYGGGYGQPGYGAPGYGYGTWNELNSSLRQ